MENKLQEEITKLNKRIVDQQIEINRLRTANNLLAQEVNTKNETIHQLREEIFLLSALK